MTPKQKSDALAMFEARAKIAEAHGLESTAACWRELAANVAKRPAMEIICTRDFSAGPEEAPPIR